MHTFNFTGNPTAYYNLQDLLHEQKHNSTLKSDQSNKTRKHLLVLFSHNTLLLCLIDARVSKSTYFNQYIRKKDYTYTQAILNLI